MNLFDSNIRINDTENSLLIKSMDSKGLQKFVNVMDAVRALVKLSETNWFLYHSIENSTPLAILFKDLLCSIKELNNQEFYSVQESDFLRPLELVGAFKKELEKLIELGVINDTSFASGFYFATQGLPVTIALKDSLEFLHEESLKNTIGFLEVQDYPEDIDWKSKVMETMSRAIEMLCKEPNTAKALWGTHLFKILDFSGAWFKQSGKSLTKELYTAKESKL